MKTVIANLSDKDRRLLMAVIPVVVFLLLLIGARTLMAQRVEVSDHLERALEDIAWLQAQGEQVQSRTVGQGCTGRGWSLDLVFSLARRHSVNLASPPRIENGELHLQIDSTQGNAVVGMLVELSCLGGRIHRFDLATLSEQGEVQGTLVLLEPVT